VLLLAHHGNVQGGAYDRLVPLAQALEKKGRLLGTIVCYRALLVAILTRAYARAYGHAAEYLRALRRLDAHVDDYGSLTRIKRSSRRSAARTDARSVFGTGSAPSQPVRPPRRALPLHAVDRYTIDHQRVRVGEAYGLCDKVQTGDRDLAATGVESWTEAVDNRMMPVASAARRVKLRCVTFA
jgi:uncharacterized protein DUF6880